MDGNNEIWHVSRAPRKRKSKEQFDSDGLLITDLCPDEEMPNVYDIRKQLKASYGLSEEVEVNKGTPGTLEEKLNQRPHSELAALAGVVFTNQKTEMEKLESEIVEVLELTYNLQKKVQHLQHKLKKITTFVVLD